MVLKVLFWFFLLLDVAAFANEDFIFNGFHAAKLSLDGPAEIMPNGLLILNNESMHQKSHAFYPTPLHLKKSPLDIVFSFSTFFVFAIVPEYVSMGTSGFTFAVTPSKNFSTAFPNQFLGLFNSSDNGSPANHVFAVEFDTVINTDLGDINANHIGIDINSARSNNTLTAGYFSSNGEFNNLSLISGDPMQVWIEYDSNYMVLNVTLSPLYIPKPTIPLLSTTINLSSIVLDHVYVGFSSSTTKIYSRHCILGWSFNIDGPAQVLDLSSLPPVPKVNRTSKTKHNNLRIWLPFGSLMLVLVILGISKFILIRRMKFLELLEDWEMDFRPHRFLYKELYQATNGFRNENLLGVGGFGKVYKGILSTSKIEIAVKKVSHHSKQGVREFISEIASMGELRHRNLVQLLGYCRRRGELLLVYDFMQNGSLDKYLFGHDKPILSWDQRLTIIKGVASGLLYLHEDWEQVVVHRDVKASNVLLDSCFNARLGDFGIARLYDHGTDPKTTHVVGTLGYIAPELAKYGKATTSTDVFAFGVFLLEVACGRRPIDPTKHATEHNLVDWVFDNWKNGTIVEARDSRLEPKYVAEDLEMVLKLGLLCSHKLPSARPSMRQIVQFLDGSSLLPDLSMDHTSIGSLEGMQRITSFDYIMSYPSLVSRTQSSSDTC